MPTIPANDPRLTWSGIHSLEEGPGWTKAWRVPHTDLDLYSPGVSDLAGRAAMPSGVRLRFSTDAQQLTVATEPLAEDGNFDLVIDNEIAATTAYAANATEVAFADLPSGDKTVEVWLSPAMPVAVRHLAIPDRTDIAQSEDTRLKWVTYGSSITHCRTAGSPATTWPGVVARGQNFNLTSMGYGGQCHADPLIARLIRDRPADFVSVKIGINIYSAASLSPRSFRPAILGTIATIRDGHPNTPFAVCSPIWGHDRETTQNAVGLTLEQMRVEIKEAVESHKQRGDDQIYYIDGLKLFDESLAEYLPDNLHPDAKGYEIMGQNFLKEVFEVQGVEVG
ncbi:MAG: SGNH/GDSL hydrolase family protein [Candidatus Latescibacterota bacterium]|nr:SGNH/GDSL hydrolase family protein [Candidatus Latescibacterota bacterium]